MWSLTAATLVFVVLRIDTRVFIVRSDGIDDHVYVLAFAFLVFYSLFTTISALYGFGQSMADIPNPDDAVRAVLFEAIGQTFAVVGMAVAKWSLGLFLLRLVNTRWHEIAVTMVCIGIPIARPLYKRYLDKLTSRDTSKYRHQSEAASYGLRTFGGSTMHPGKGKDGGETSDSGSDPVPKKLGLGGSFTKAYAVGGKPHVRGDDESEDSILSPDFRRSQRAMEAPGSGITVTYEVHTSRGV
ncbi:hypothetical protein CSOJ01_15634 [Colletotrichum sojae]|uniref:Rhodopsin domain-containing protein n=1 Tax=Colletotrichum sojae TaxID=2175907 RepID=A0A8H6MIH4_9PEZI|nr:hypothetical protein CSOJ01_15634 [Colletotrichum sojae]